MTSNGVSLPRAGALWAALTVLVSSVAAAQTPVSTPSAGAATEAVSLRVPALAAGTAAGITSPDDQGTVQQRMASPEAVARALGADVRVAFSRGERNGILVSLSASEVVLRTREGDAAIPLAEVQMIRKTSHRVRNGAVGGFLMGAALGVVRAAVGPPIDVPDALSPILFASIFGGIGAAVGAGIGGGLNAARADHDVIYDSSRPTVLVAPLLSPRRAGIALAVRW